MYEEPIERELLKCIRGIGYLDAWTQEKHNGIICYSIDHAVRKHGIYFTGRNLKKKFARRLETDTTFRTIFQASGKDANGPDLLEKLPFLITV